MAPKDVFTAADLPPNLFTLETARTPDEYIAAFRVAHQEVSLPEQWVAFMDALRDSHFTSTHAFGLTDWVMHELVPSPPDEAPHKLRILRHYEHHFAPKATVAYVSLLHKHERKLALVLRNGTTSDAPMSYSLATKILPRTVVPPIHADNKAVYEQFDYFLKTYRFPSEIAHSSVRRLS